VRKAGEGHDGNVDAERVAFLFERYQALTSLLQGSPPLTTRGTLCPQCGERQFERSRATEMRRRT
jgi:hypothetical protein